MRGPTKKLEGRFVISEVSTTGEPLLPQDHAKKFVNHCGFLVRDNVGISVREWKVKKNDPQVSYVSDRDKDIIWNEVIAHFDLPAGTEALVKSWALKKMATQFQTFKKTLYNKFIKKNLTPNFTGQYEKLRDHWDEFVRYKTSEEGEARVRRNQENAHRK